MTTPAPTPTPVPRRSAFRTFLLWCAVSVGVCLLALGSVVWSAVTLSREARTLKDAMVATLDAPVTTKVQVTAGPGLLAAARGVLWFLPEVPADATTALGSVRSASVGVYQLTFDAADRRGCVRQSDARMSARGWQRVVGVNDGNSTVLVYAPQGASSHRRLDLCIAVMEGRDLVVVSTEVEPEVLLPLVRRHLPAGAVEL